MDKDSNSNDMIGLHLPSKMYEIIMKEVNDGKYKNRQHAITEHIRADLKAKGYDI